jgi:hypothetical protein
MICLICKTDISPSIKQFGDIHHPICQACYLADNEWVTDNPDLMALLEDGMSLGEAMLTENKKRNDDFNQHFLEEMHDISLGLALYRRSIANEQTN